MTLTVGVVLLVLVAVLFLIFVFFKRKTSEDKWPYYSKKVMTEPEQVLFHRLVKALPDCIVLSQVQPSRVLGVKKGNNFNQWNNRISRMSLDFVVCAKDSSVLTVIELDDSSHDRRGRQKADGKKDKALRDAGVRLIRWNVKSMPDEVTIKNEVLVVEAK